MTYAPQSSPGQRTLPAFRVLVPAVLLALAALLPTRSIAGQARQVLAAQTRVHATPGGASLGLLSRGSAFTSRRTDGTSVELLVEGWIFARSVGSTRQDGFDLAVTRAGGENLRSSPSANGPIVAHVARGVLLEKVAADSHGWVHVRRYAWVPRTALKSPPAAPTGSAPPRPVVAPAERADTSRAPDVPLAPAPIGSGNTDRAIVSRPTPLLAAPEGAVATTLPAATEVRVLTRAGDWTQVAVSGWVRTSDIAPPTDQAEVGVSAAQVRANPAQYVGKVLEWRLQVVAVMVADELRPEIPAGRTYLLTRGPLPEQGFVYVILPPDQVDRFRQLAPLKEFTFRVQVRAASTRYLPNPVVDLVQVVAGS